MENEKHKQKQRKNGTHLSFYHIIRLWNETTVSRTCMQANEKRITPQTLCGGHDFRPTLACHGLTKYRNCIFSICLFILCVSFFGSLDVHPLFWRFSFALDENQNAPFIYVHLQFTPAEMCARCTRFTIQLSSRRNMSVKRQKVKNTERNIRMSWHTTGRRLLTHTHTHTLQIRFHNRHRIVIAVPIPMMIPRRCCNRITTGIYLQGKLLCDYKFSFRQLRDEKHKQKLWHENNNNSSHHRTFSPGKSASARILHAVGIHHRLLVAASDSCLVLSHHRSHILHVCMCMH